MNRIFSFLLLLFFLTNFCKAQKIDLLLDSLKLSSDTTRVLILNQLSEAYFKSDAKPKKGKKSDLDKAEDFAMEGLKYSEKIKYKSGTARSYFNLGKCYLKKKDYRGAELSFLNSVELAKELKEHQLVLKNIDYIFKFHKELGNTNNSIAYADMKSSYKDVMLRELETEKQKAAIEYQAEVSQRDSLLKVEKEKVEALTNRPVKIPKPETIVKYKTTVNYIPVFIFLFLFLVMGGVAFWFMELKNRKKRQLEKAEMKIKALYKKLEELNQESNGILKKGMLRKDLNPTEEAANLKIAQLLGHANFIIQKNEILVQLETNYNGLKESKIGDLSKKISDLGAVINSNYNAEKDWENFLMHFESVFPNYLKQIKEKNPGQTVLEIKVSVLKKVALTLHEMSHILHIPEEEIEKTLESLNSRQGRIETV